MMWSPDMIMHKPTLILKRLVIQKNGNPVYDEVFREGVNIIRGTNGSGKTTIVESIFYVLGGDVPKKKAEFSFCDYVYGEFEINRNTFTLKRSIEEDGKYPPIEIFEGNYNQAMADGQSWTQYPNKRSNEKKSYSQILFELLEFPEDKTPEGQNVTIHDILRLIFEDQNTTSGKIFLNQNYPEQGIKRQAISDLLLGIDDSELHALRLERYNREKEFSGYDGQLKQIYDVFGSADMDINSHALDKEKKDIQKEQQEIDKKIETPYTDNTVARTDDANKNFEKIRNNISKIKQDISIKEQTINSLSFEVEDSYDFIKSLNFKITALSASTMIAKTIGQIKLAYCPSCLEDLKDDPDPDHGTCALCKSDLKDDGLSVGYLKMRNEIAFQKRESEDIIKRKNIRIQKIKPELQSLSEELKMLERQSKNFINALNPIEAEVKILLERSGYLDRALQDVIKREELANKVDDISAKKAQLASIISDLNDKIQTAVDLRESRKNKIYTDINDITIDLIKRDPIHELQNVDRISFDFYKDEILAVGKNSPAASTGSYLKNVFFFSLFLISLRHQIVRYPRFIIMDNIEANGLQNDRVQQFHKDIIKHSEDTKIKHQIIFTARSEVITNELEQSGLCIGENYDEKKDTYSLRFAQKTEQN